MEPTNGQPHTRNPAGNGPRTADRAAARAAVKALVMSIHAGRPLSLPGFLRLFDRQCVALDPRPLFHLARQAGSVAAAFLSPPDGSSGAMPGRPMRERLERLYRRAQPFDRLRSRCAWEMVQ